MYFKPKIKNNVPFENKFSLSETFFSLHLRANQSCSFQPENMLSRCKQSQAVVHLTDLFVILWCVSKLLFKGKAARDELGSQHELEPTCRCICELHFIICLSFIYLFIFLYVARR